MNLEPAVMALAVARRTAYSLTQGHEIRCSTRLAGVDQLPLHGSLFVEATALIQGDGLLSLQRWENDEWTLPLATGFLEDHHGIAPLDAHCWVPLGDADRLDMRVLIDGNWQGGAKLRISYDLSAHPLTPDI